MKIFTHPIQEYNTVALREEFENNNPIPWITIDNFLDGDIVNSLKGELDYEYTHNSEKHKMFTRAGSNMFEVLNNHEFKYAHELISHVHSAPFLKFLEDVTGFRGLICDPYLTGAGYMRCGEGDSLKIHTDFNWNDQLYLHRALSVIFYLNPVWDETWNGDLQLWDKERKGKVHSIFPGNGNMLIWMYDKLGYHGHPNPINAPKGHYRDGFRFFFYVSSSEYKKDDLPHRSLYYYDDKNNIPVDKS
jgi:Rps23 Pro-64 3,4-dihydroxylase Tpa1-like proline 4-hydroxylase